MECQVCGIKNTVQINLFTPDEIEIFIHNIILGNVKPDKLDVNQYRKIAQKLKEAVFIGFGGNEDAFVTNPKRLEVLQGFIDNVYEFAAAKQYQLVREIVHIANFNLAKDKADFFKQATELFIKYNVTYFSTELDSAEWTASGAKDFLDFIDWDNE
jgi:hypothetical protein